MHSPKAANAGRWRERKGTLKRETYGYIVGFRVRERLADLSHGKMLRESREALRLPERGIPCIGIFRHDFPEEAPPAAGNNRFLALGQFFQGERDDRSWQANSLYPCNPTDALDELPWVN